MDSDAPKLTEEKSPQQSVMDVVPPKPSGKDEHETTVNQQATVPQKQKVAKPPKQPGNGVGLAIFATVVIVLGLAALMVYAYFRSKNITPF